MNRLVEEIVKPFLTEMTPRNIKKVIGVYGGRFQPFGPHHLKTYKWLEKQVDEAYITTSDIKKPPRHPMNFKEKVRHMSKMGVKSNRIIKEKSPYVADNLLKKFDPETTAVVYIFGAKDAGRLSGGSKKTGGLKYYQDYKKNKPGNIKPYKEHGYVLTAPHVSISIGGKEVSGTSMRELLGSPKIDDSERGKLFKKMFGYFNKGVFNMMVNKFKKLFESLVDEDVNVRIDGFRDYDSPESSDIEQPYKPKKKLKKENVTLPIKVGDTILMGRFKNKRVKVKTITTNEKGDLLINGRSALKFRMPDGGKVLLPKPPEISTNPYDDIEEIIQKFLTTIDINEIINEASTVSGMGLGVVDDGPSALMGGKAGYFGRNKEWAEKLGFHVVNYILDIDVSKIPPFKGEFVGGKSVSYLPAGIGTGATPNNPENLTGAKGYNKWVKDMKKIAQNVGFELMNFLDKDEKERKKQIAKDTKATLKQQKKEEAPESKPKDSSDGHGSVKESTFSKDWWNKLLTEGGAYGHMAHPFDDKDLTFGDLKKIIELGLGGQLNREDNVTEKLDGQNIMISWKDGKLIAARNKGHIKNGGKTALDAKGIASKFKGRGDIRNAFVYAMRDLEKSIKGLSQKQKDKIFDNGHNFMNMEVMWPKSANVIDYDVATLIFHGALKYNDNGDVLGEVPGSGKILAGMIQQINQHIQKKYSIGKPVFLEVPKHQDFGKMKSKFLSRLSKLQSQFGLTDKDTLALYHQKWWESFIRKQNKKVPNKILKGLVKRWAFFDKSYTVADIKSDIKDEKFLDWILSYDKNNHAKQVKTNMKPFETLFFEVGAEILKNVKGFIAANPDKAVQGIKKRLDKAISNVKGGGDLKKLNTLKLQLDKLNSIGGIDSIVPSEGIVFKYKGNTYKFTGAFAPINQITGLISF